MDEAKKEGWGPGAYRGRKWHYYRDKRSLCGGYGWLFDLSELEQGNDVSPDNCAACRRKRLKEIEAK